MSGLVDVLAEFGLLLAELAVLLLVVSAGLALVVRRVGVSRLRGWLGGRPLPGAVKGLTVGFLTPFCTYSAIPVLVGLIDARIRTATVAAFMLAAPLLDPVVGGVLVLLFGWQATAAYLAATTTTVLLLALAADAAGLERWLQPRAASGRAPAPAAERVVATTAGGRPAEVPLTDASSWSRPATPTAPAAPASDSTEACATEDEAGADPFTDTSPWTGWRTEAAAAGRYAVDLARGLAVPMVIAVAIAAAITGWVPHELVARVAGPSSPAAVPAAAVLGAPFYVSAEAFLPVASALHEAGMGLGAVFAVTISAAGVNLPELGVLTRLMAPRLLVGYAAAIVGIAIIAGELIPLVL